MSEENVEIEVEAPVRKEIILGALVLGLFWVIFLWGFWRMGIYALGINATVFLLGLGSLIYCADTRNADLLRSGKSWIIPLLLMALSYSFFENPFIKLVNLLVIPLTWTVFYRHAVISREQEVIWTPKFVLISMCTTLLFPQFWALGGISFFRSVKPRREIKFTNAELYGRIAKGILLLMGLSLFVVVPLLSSADLAFSEKISHITDSIYQLFVSIFELTLVAKVCTIVLVACLAVGGVKFARHFDQMKQVDTLSSTDSVVAGIVLSGILGLYAVFIWVQVEQLWFSALPAQFVTTERLVKGGFWQLILVSVVNILLFTWCYRRTNRTVQLVLSLFTPACLILVLSAANKMWLYVMTYGFSYEKFYAFYTVVFCLVVFLFLLAALSTAQRQDIVKFTCFLFLWMYGVVTVLPVERIVLGANIALASQERSRVAIDEMTMLSADVISIVDQHGFHSDVGGKVSPSRWQLWYDRNCSYLSTKPWYELNLSNIWNNRCLFSQRTR